ncbi:MAG TPA: isochorismatase family cysteine hydrolase [Rhizobiaceae bacterium]|nr:isochorismatase family cysteine hydrolase [Rhizobiaceae bacterium]
MAASGLTYGPLDAETVHLCIDMQRIFDEGAPWATPWMARVLPNVERIVAHRPAQTIFTRFIPAERPGEGVGAWQRYYRRWAEVTIEVIGTEKIELLPSLGRFAPPAKVIDKRVYSPWTEGRLDALLASTDINTLVMTGTETDVCVLATVLGAVDRGYRVVVVTDALCSSSDETHDALMTFYHQRLGQQVETAETDEILRSWR